MKYKTNFAPAEAQYAVEHENCKPQYEINTFFNEDLGVTIRAKEIDDEPWFVGKDVAVALGYSDPSRAVFTHVDEEDKTALLICQSGSNYKSKTTFINESGLYSLILSSKLPTAKKFKRWVTSEVLPSIRQKGGYLTSTPDDDPEAIIARALVLAKDKIESLKAQTADLLEENKELSVKAYHLDNVLACEQCYTTTQIAKELGLTAQQLNKVLMDKHILYKASCQYMLYAQYACLGLAKNRTYNGVSSVSPQLVWTESGRLFIHNLFKSQPMRINGRLASRMIMPDLFEEF